MKRLYVVGIGPGEEKKMTLEAAEVLESCAVIAGYQVYVDLIRERYPDKEYRITAMRQEKERCRLALESADLGRITAMICSGDAGVYGMAGILLEMGERYPEVEISIIPGVSAVLSGSALLGAPIGHDFAVISLSDLLTPWETIEKRLAAAAMADFVICLYNPSSKKRKDHLKRACDIILRYQPKETVCGYARNIARAGQAYKIMSLSELCDEQVDMFTTVFVGNSTTKRIGDRMVTGRGYRIK